MTLQETILKLTKQLYPTGRAFKMPAGSFFEKLHKALAVSEASAFSAAKSILDSAIPDNTNFTEQDATDWERRLGMVSNPVVALSDRKLAIQRKLNHPGTIPARQNYRYLEGQLQAAGFDVYVYENRFDDGMGGLITKTPGELTGGGGVGTAQFGDFQFGDFQLGNVFDNIIVNYINEGVDNNFSIGNNLRSTFFIGGNPIGSYAGVDADRKDEFRQLILRIKPVQTVGFLFINYV